MTAPSWIWHDVEHGGYEADLPLWRELAEAADGPILDLGAGTGRVAADLAARGHEVTALDSDPGLLAALAERAPSVTTVTADALDFDLGERFALVIAPMQLVQILGGADARLAMLRRAHAHLTAGGRLAAAIADPHDALPDGAPDAFAGDPRGGAAAPPLPDMVERDGWLFSSQPVSVEERTGCVVVTRRREVVSPRGEREEEQVEIALDLVDAEELAGEAREAGFADLEWREIGETPDHVGSKVLVCRR
jgi:SAM-dependent methyltransferase